MCFIICGYYAKLIFVELRNLTSTDAQTLHGTYLLHCINLFKAAWEKCWCSTRYDSSQHLAVALKSINMTESHSLILLARWHSTSACQSVNLPHLLSPYKDKVDKGQCSCAHLKIFSCSIVLQDLKWLTIQRARSRVALCSDQSCLYQLIAWPASWWPGFKFVNLKFESIQGKPSNWLLFSGA